MYAPCKFDVNTNPSHNMWGVGMFTFLITKNYEFKHGDRLNVDYSSPASSKTFRAARKHSKDCGTPQ